MKKTVLDAEEKDILESYERGEWKPVKNPKAEIRKLQGYAKWYKWDVYFFMRFVSIS